MAEVKVRHVIDVPAINRMLTSRDGGLARDMLRRGYRVEAYAKDRCPVDQGRLRGSIHTQLIQSPYGVGVEVGTDVDYAIYVHEGTGLYGPRAAKIFPSSAKVMVFSPRKSGGKFVARAQRGKVFARWTRGMKGVPFLRDALLRAAG